MNRSKPFPRTRFPADVVRSARDFVAADAFGSPVAPTEFSAQFIFRNGEVLGFDVDDDFFAEYGRDYGSVRGMWQFGGSHALEFRWRDSGDTEVTVTMPNRAAVDRVLEVFEQGLTRAELPPVRPRIVISHGHNRAWRDLRDFLQDQHHLQVRAFETSPRAGRTIQDVLDELLTGNDMALLVHTGEDEQEDGEVRARQNVVHETGMFQARYGSRRAIIVRQDNCESFSNMNGIIEIRFTNDIRETFGEVLGTINREFP